MRAMVLLRGGESLRIGISVIMSRCALQPQGSFFAWFVQLAVSLMQNMSDAALGAWEDHGCWYTHVLK